MHNGDLILLKPDRLTMSIKFQLANPKNRSEFFRLVSLPAHSKVQRLEGYTILVITEGNGKFIRGEGEHYFSKNTIICLSPFEPFEFLNDAGGYQLTFHPDFLCVYKHHSEVACNGVLFDNIYGPPLSVLEANDLKRLLSIIEQMKEEFKSSDLARQEALISLLKIFLIYATRIKVNQQPSEVKNLEENGPLVLLKLKDAVEKNYKEKHTASDYAAMLNISTKALSRLTRAHFNKKLSDMIADRIFIEAKRELYLTSKTVKEIAYSLGFKDEFYFSRFFKNKATVSPQHYREAIGQGKLQMVQ